MQTVTIGGHTFTLRENTLRANKVRRVLLRNLLNFIDNGPFESISDEVAFRETHDPHYVDIIGCLYAFDGNPRAGEIRLWVENLVAWDDWLLKNETEDTQRELFNATEVARKLNTDWYPVEYFPVPEESQQVADAQMAAFDPEDESDVSQPTREELREAVEKAQKALEEARGDKTDFLDPVS